MSPQGFDCNPVYSNSFWNHYVEFMSEALDMEVPQEIEESEVSPGELDEEEAEELQFYMDDVIIPPRLRRQSSVMMDDGFECDTIPPSPLRVVWRESTVPERGPSIENILLEADVVALMLGLAPAGSAENPIDLTML